jgi:hypothetical protein
MTPLHDFAELRALLDALCEESITPEQLRQLEALVLEDPRAEAFYIQYMSQQADLAGHFGAPPAKAERSLRDLAGATASDAAQPVPGPAGKRPRPARRRSRVLLWSALGLSALAAGILVVIFWPRPSDTIAQPIQSPEASDDTVAVLLQAPEALWDDADPAPRAGAPLAPGWLRLKSGFARVEFYSGATVVLEGPAELQLVSRMEAYCAHGKLRATVPPQAHGFTIRSPALDLVDRGTEFGLHVGAADQTEVHVFQGKVDLYDAGHSQEAGARKQELTTGHGVRLEGPGVVRPIAADPTTFKTAEDVAAQLLEDARRRQKDWLASSEALRRDPKIEVYYPFLAEDAAGRTLHDQARDRRNPQDGVIVGCTWGAGRWPGKPGLEFGQVSDRVRINVAGEFNSLTLAAWVRVDALPNRFNSLMMTDGSDLAAPHWHISNAGRIELGVQGWDQKGWTHYLTPAVLTPVRLGEWTFLAVVYDRAAGEVVHYVNGEAVKREAIRTDVPLHIGDAEIGNWNIGTQPHPNPIRFFRGCMDEFMVLSRPLDQDEIGRLYAHGRPPS